MGGNGPQRAGPFRKGAVMARSTSRLSESEREQRRARDRERLKLAAEELLTSEGWERWVHVRSRNGLSRYSAIILSASVVVAP